MKVITYSVTCDKVHQNVRTAIKSQNIGKENRRRSMSANKRRNAKAGIWRG